MSMIHTRRILYIQYANPPAYPSLQHSSRLLADMDWQVMFLGIFAAENDVLRFPDHENIVVRQLPFSSSGLRQKLHYFWFSLWVVGWMLRWRPQWIYTSDLLACPVALPLSFLPGIRVVYHEHDSPDESGTGPFLRLCLRARKWLARRARMCVLPNQQRAELFSETVADSKPVFCIWNCPELAEVTVPREPRMKNQMIVYYHGVIGESYLSSQVLEAMAMLPPQVHFRVIGYETVGTEGYSAYCRQEIRRLGIEDRVEWLGPVPRFEALRYCVQSDVGLATIPIGAEDINGIHKTGASNKPFDFLACGLALLVSDLPDWQAMYVKPGYGLACDPNNPESIAAALRWFLDHPEKMREMGEKGRKRILSEWNYENQFARVLKALSNSAT